VPAYQAGSITLIQAVSGKGTSYEALETITDWQADETLRPWIIYRDGGWSRNQWYRITAIWGYGPAPEQIVEVTLEAAVNIWYGSPTASGQSEVGVPGAGAMSFSRALTWSQRAIIEGVRTGYLGLVHA
jgi:hypothetical protein